MTPRTRKRVPVAADVYRRTRRTSKHRWPVWTEDGEEGRWKEDERVERPSRRRGARRATAWAPMCLGPVIRNLRALSTVSGSLVMRPMQVLVSIVSPIRIYANARASPISTSLRGKKGPCVLYASM